MLMDGSVGTLTFNGGGWPSGCYIGRDGATGILTINAGTLSSKGTAGRHRLGVEGRQHRCQRLDRHLERQRRLGHLQPAHLPRRPQRHRNRQT